jgi:hypothetical protein
VETPVEIRYEGVVIDRIHAVSGTMEQGGILLLSTTEPMPVGTRLELCSGAEVSQVRVVRVTEVAAPATSTMHVRAVGLSEPFEVTLLPNPEYSGEHRSEPKVQERPPARPPALPVEPTPEPLVQTEADGEAVPEAIGADPSMNGAGDHDEISGLHDTNASSEYPAGNGANNKRRRRRRR